MATHRVLKKKRRVEKDALDRRFDSELGAIKRERDKALADAGAAFRKGLEELREQQKKARAKAWAKYDDDREKILKRLGDEAKAA
jgi:hypothetical protein